MLMGQDLKGDRRSLFQDNTPESAKRV